MITDGLIPEFLDTDSNTTLLVSILLGTNFPLKNMYVYR